MDLGMAAHAPTILLVDDDPMILRVLARAFSSSSANVVAVRRAFGLLNQIAEVRPAVVVLDVHMPGLDGASLVQLIRDDAAIRDTRVLLYSGLDPHSLAEVAAACGADAWITKDQGAAGVVAAVNRLLGSGACPPASVAPASGRRGRADPAQSAEPRRTTLRGMPAMRLSTPRQR